MAKMETNLLMNTYDFGWSSYTRDVNCHRSDEDSLSDRKNLLHSFSLSLSLSLTLSHTPLSLSFHNV